MKHTNASIQAAPLTRYHRTRKHSDLPNDVGKNEEMGGSHGVHTMTHNSCKAWKMIKKLSNDLTTSNPPCLVSANQVAHQLLDNGRGTMRSKRNRPVLPPATEVDHSMVYPFSREEYMKGITILKNNKDMINFLVVNLKNLSPKAYRWLLTMLNKMLHGK